MELHDLGILELSSLLRRRRLSAVELWEHTMARIERLNPELNAYLSLRPGARRDAIAADRRLRRGPSPSPLCGIPIAMKDLVLSRDQPATAGSRVFGDGVVGERDAPVFRQLRRAGAVIIGRTNLHEIALGVTTVNEHFGPARNPWNAARVAGGSSGGSAVAAAAGLCAGAIGTDTRGSIRIPAACCGIVGLKPTRGLVSTDSVIPLSHTLDHVGPMTRSVVDAAAMLGAMVGRPKLTALWEKATRRSARKLRVGVSEYHLRDLDSAVHAVVEAALRAIQKLGVRVSNVSIPGINDVQAASIVITASEAVAYHDHALKTDPTVFGPMVRERLQAGYQWTAVDYLKAQEIRERFEQEVRATFESVDILFGATLPVLPPLISDQIARLNGRDVPTVDAMSRFNAVQNMSGNPAMSVPAGFSATGLPVGVQLMAAHGREDLLFSLGAAYQSLTDWHRRRPSLDGA